MKLLLIGGGGREHALAWKLARDKARPTLFCAPGNAGTAALGTNVAIQAEDMDGLLDWARRERPELTVVGPEAPLCAGLADRFQAEGFRVFGPNQAAAQLEGSKVFSKDVLLAAGVPSAQSASFDDAAKALAYVRSASLPLVVKADGLAAGKGVLICTTREQAEDAIRQILVSRAFGPAGRKVLVEEFIEGEEVSVLAMVDGTRAVLLPSAQDHKRIFDGDQGPNTGGMGAYSPAPMESPAFRKLVQTLVFDPTLKELGRRGIRYQGVLYAGLMMTKSGPQVLEFNCRFGDPETQAILPRLTGDLIPAMEACIDGGLTPELVACRPEPCVCVVMAAGGYPGNYRKGDVIEGLDAAAAMQKTEVFHAGTRLDKGRVVTAGGRVLGVTALGSNLAGTAASAYQAVSAISFSGAQYRRDIAARGLKRK
ncbi:MAG: phosphoribosylamine--glycine ligase [Verrucomicrobia bacterium]|nr:phosphoribosylamine--glycine ligase [Verrucomicrobiota bacterium]MBU4247690.1 phosphoribosylamine--glycine ligase [Verrucomicrobiota bacterium]MBU4290367.1 phosphoribosylamine--glycine ligase [Verrucomicrobiota bacterium]MBU4496680.1 phosphoribosylamine--glycine ligase [Verrucomicrobiota bacterium]MCG2679869.1 phosphoribosylamine--glycine ligase [Kiritimatiellia bacterium]